MCVNKVWEMNTVGEDQIWKVLIATLRSWGSWSYTIRDPH